MKNGILKRGALRGLLGAVAVAAGCQFGTLSPPTTPPTECSSGQHVWGPKEANDPDKGYHLPASALSPVVVNKSGYTPDLVAWNDLKTPIRLRSLGDGFTITIVEGECPGCLGLASIKLDSSGHITWGKVTMNRAKLDQMKTEAADHVLCQELGHLLGLSHHKALDSCMDDCSGRADWMACLTGEQGTTPNYHDAEQLEAIYAHAKGLVVPKCMGSLVIHKFEVPK